MPPLRALPRRWSGLALLLGLVAAPAQAGVPFSLPTSEDPGAWRGALALAAALDPSAPLSATGPSVEIQETARPSTWRLRVRDAGGVLHEVEVPRPTDDHGREDVVALAASLLQPVGGVAIPFGPAPRTPAPPRPAPAPVAPPRRETPVLRTDSTPGEAPEPPPPPEPVATPEPIVRPESLPPPEPRPAPEAIAPPLPAFPAHPWMSVSGGLDLKADTGTSFGGEVLAGVAFDSGVHTGLGIASGTRHDLSSLARARGAAYQDMELFATLWWAPTARLAPVAGLRLGGAWRTFWQGEDRVEVTYGDASAGVAAVVPVAVLDTGLAIRVVPGLALVPALRVRADLPGLGSSGVTPPSCIRWADGDPSACDDGNGAYLSLLSLGITLSMVVEPSPGDPDGRVAARQGR